MTGKLFGIGVGPGDPEFLTLKAKRILDAVPVIFVPVKGMDEESTALKIVRSVVDVEKKEIVKLLFTMEGNQSTFKKCGEDASKIIAGHLSGGQDAAMISLGDISVYSTYMYLNQYVEGMGFDTEIVPGITSFCSAAALAKISLMMGGEGLAVVPSVNDNELLQKAMDDFHNVVIMKAGGSMERIEQMMADRNIPLGQATVVSRAGMDGQYIGPIDKSRKFSYFTTIVIKKPVGGEI